MKRYIVLEFDDTDDPSFGDCNDYDPPLLHPATRFMMGLEDDHYLWVQVGAGGYAEVPAHVVPTEELKHPQPAYSRGWLDNA